MARTNARRSSTSWQRTLTVAAGALLACGCADGNLSDGEGAHEAALSSRLGGFHPVPAVTPHVYSDATPTGTPPAPPATAAGGSYLDPIFGTKIIRVTDNIGGNSPGNVDPRFKGSCENAYSTWNAFNANDSRFLIECNSVPLVYNFNTSSDTPTLLGDLAGGQPYAVQPEGATWSSTDPNIIYALGASTASAIPAGCTSRPNRALYRINVADTSASRFTVVRDFTNDLNAQYSTHACWSVSRLTKADDDSKFSFVTGDATTLEQTWSDAYFLNGTTLTVWPRVTGFAVHSADLNKPGTQIIIPEGTLSQPTVNGQTAVWQLASNTTSIIQSNATEKSGGHGDYGKLMVTDDVWNSGLVERSYVDSPNAGIHRPTSIFTYATSNVNSAGNGCIPDHVSLRDDSEEYAVVSTYQQSSCDPTSKCATGCKLAYDTAFANEIFLVKTDGSGQYFRLAHTYSQTTLCTDADPNCYEHQVRASVDRFGAYIIFHTDLGTGGTGTGGTNDVFIVKVPSNLVPPGSAACGGRQVSTQTDPANCGGCGVTCASGQCSAGSCVSACPVPCGSSCCDPSRMYCAPASGKLGEHCAVKKGDNQQCTSANQCQHSCCWDDVCEPVGFPFCPQAS